MADDLEKKEAPASDMSVTGLSAGSNMVETESGTGSKIDDLSALGDAVGNEKSLNFSTIYKVEFTQLYP